MTNDEDELKKGANDAKSSPISLPRRDSPVFKKRKIIIDSDGKDEEDDINYNEKAVANVEAVQSAQMLHHQYQL
jgi:hypothetical protein